MDNHGLKKRFTKWHVIADVACSYCVWWFDSRLFDVHATNILLSLSSLIWYWTKGGDVLRLGR